MPALAAAAAKTNQVPRQGSTSIARGKYISKIGGCNDCHTPGYAEKAGHVPMKTWLTGVHVGNKGPWGTTYAKNLRLVAAGMSEDQWVKHLTTLRTAPPMPWYDVNILPDSDKRSLYRFIKSLGAPGEATPADLPPGQTPKTLYVVTAPPTMPHG
jgi:hypothetical protein